jgi:hypothetical protein
LLFFIIIIIIIIIIIAITTRRPRLHSHQSDEPKYLKTLDSTALENTRSTALKVFHRHIEVAFFRVNIFGVDRWGKLPLASPAQSFSPSLGGEVGSLISQWVTSEAMFG